MMKSIFIIHFIVTFRLNRVFAMLRSSLQAERCYRPLSPRSRKSLNLRTSYTRLQPYQASAYSSSERYIGVENRQTRSRYLFAIDIGTECENATRSVGCISIDSVKGLFPGTREISLDRIREKRGVKSRENMNKI